MKERVFFYSLYSEWQSIDGAQGKLDKMCNIAYIELLEHLQRQLIDGKKNRNLSFVRKREDKISGNRAVQRGMDKAFAHEEIVKLKQVIKDEKEFFEKLEEVKKLAESILKINNDDQKQINLKKTIEILMELREGNHE